MEISHHGQVWRIDEFWQEILQIRSEIISASPSIVAGFYTMGNCCLTINKYSYFGKSLDRRWDMVFTGSYIDGSASNMSVPGLLLDLSKDNYQIIMSMPLEWLSFSVQPLLFLPTSLCWEVFLLLFLTPFLNIIFPFHFLSWNLWIIENFDA